MSRVRSKNSDEFDDGLRKFFSAALPLAKSLAAHFRQNRMYSSNKHRVQSLLVLCAGANFANGFISGFGGVATLPATIGASLASAGGTLWSYQVQVLTIAFIYGHTEDEPGFYTTAALALLGPAGASHVLEKSGWKFVGMQTSQRLTMKALRKIPQSVLLKVNKILAIKLLAHRSATAYIKLVNLVPVAGGIFAGLWDSATSAAVGKSAERMFSNA